MFNYKYRLKFQLAMNDVYFLQNWGVRPWLRNIAVGGGLGLDYGAEGGGGKKYQKFDYVICERPQITGHPRNPKNIMSQRQTTPVILTKNANSVFRIG